MVATSAAPPPPSNRPASASPSPSPPRDELVADCRVRAATDLLMHRWDPVVLAALDEKSRDRSALRAAIGQISDKVLGQTLDRLEASGLITRMRTRTAPPRAVLSLTPLGTSFCRGPLQALGDWAETHGDDLLDAMSAGGDHAVTAEAENGVRAYSGTPHPSG
ncbi:winged helix-turn-helix transcriptional regulator [Gordonia soli]|uniref:Putative HxlR family transcriptional regulator n=1 Tax=Gordonia soli NBRC 108243 TaxID=1223545 RepID=M0QKN2_9ACTN|nr:helix-turn-helix domain-containing protein [Gordonia soli]GAC69118.1 putative HxlR family transcriptional regulator [Gordonia soli NBRC 108243]